MDCSPPGSSDHGILQARILEWVAISFSRGSSWSRHWTGVSCIAGRFFTVWATGEALKMETPQFSSVQPLNHVWLLETPWTAALQASLSITNSQSFLKLMSIKLVMPSKHLILCHPLPQQILKWTMQDCNSVKLLETFLDILEILEEFWNFLSVCVCRPLAVIHWGFG